MAAEPPPRLAQLPGFDTAPDVYETPDLDDDTTVATSQTSPRAVSEPSDTSEDEADDEERYGVSRRRLYPERARSRFGEQSRSIEPRGADLSDRVDGRRRGYRARRGPFGAEEEEEEGLEARIARLKREVEECRALAEEAKAGGEEEEEGQEGDDVEALSRLLAGIDVPASQRGAARARGDVVFHDALARVPRDGDKEPDDEDDEQTLSKIAAFDSRLSSLETALGISSVLDSDQALSSPLLPTLTLLDSQLSALTSATSLANLEAASSRISKLKAEAQGLAALQHQQQKPSTRQASEDEDEDQDTPPLTPSPEDLTRLNALYTLLPTLQSLSPTVPALITRLRSLKSLHGTAANVAADLDALEQRQADMDKELRMWREGLEKVESAVKQADEANGQNGGMVKGWVEDLEKRVKALGR